MFSKLALSAALMSSAVSAYAGNSADLTVTGSITPVACTPSFVGGGKVDYGNISPTTLNRDKVTFLDVKSVAYTITCDAPIAMATRWTDAREATLDPTVKRDSWARFGLGQAGKVNIGGFRLTEASADLLGDGKAADVLYSKDNGTTWAVASVQYNVPNGELVSYAAKGTKLPTAYSTVAGQLNVMAVVAPSAGFDFASDIEFDGLATMEVVYL